MFSDYNSGYLQAALILSFSFSMVAFAIYISEAARVEFLPWYPTIIMWFAISSFVWLTSLVSWVSKKVRYPKIVR